MKKLNWKESSKLLDKYNIPFVKTVEINLKSDIEKIDFFPVVMKVDSERIVHKTEVNAVILDIDDKEELERAYNKLGKLNEPIIVQKQVKGAELILGIKSDRTFGQVVVVGLGGIYTEALKKVSMRVVPFSKLDVADMIKESEIKKILTSRKANYDFKTLEAIILNISKMADAEKIKEMDINPFILMQTGGVAVDARIFI